METSSANQPSASGPKNVAGQSKVDGEASKEATTGKLASQNDDSSEEEKKEEEEEEEESILDLLHKQKMFVIEKCFDKSGKGLKLDQFCSVMLEHLDYD